MLSSSGRYKESIDILEELQSNIIPQTLLKQYFTEFRESYVNLSYHATLEKNKLKYTAISNQYRDSLFKILNVNSIEYLTLKEEQLRLEGKLSESKNLNSQSKKFPF